MVVPFPPPGCSPRAAFLAGDLPLVAQRGISAHKKGVLGVWEQKFENRLYNFAHCVNNVYIFTCKIYIV